MAWAVFLVIIFAGTVIVAFPRAAAPNTTGSTGGTTTGTTTGAMTGGNATQGTLNAFQTYKELGQYITANAKSVQEEVNGLEFGGATMTMVQGPVTMSTVTVTGTMTMAASTTTVAGAEASSSTSGYTTTNNQVQGVDELDIVKTDGSYLYVASSQTVSIIKAQGSSTTTVSKITLPTSDIIGIEIQPQRLAVVAQSNLNSSVEIRLYNMSDASAPNLLNSVSINGTQVAARMSQGYLYEMIQQPSFAQTGNGNVTALYPTEVQDGVSSALSPGATYYTPNKSQVSVYTIIVSVSMSTGAQQSVAVLTGPDSTVFASASNIYVVYPNYPSYYVDGIQGDIFGGSSISSVDLADAGQPQNSTVVRVAYSDGALGVDAAGFFPGVVLSQYSMNEYDGYFQVATSRAVSVNGTGSRSDDVYVLNQNFTQVGALRDIAPGENIYSVLFSGDLGYVVTFEQVDPLFTISFANPASPVILSALTVTGFSDYLYPWGNGYLIGVGKDTVAASNGDFSYYLGLKLSLFQIASDGTSTEVSNYMIGDRGTDSPVLDNPLAFTFDSATNVTVIPVDLYKVQGSQTSPPGSPPPYGQEVWQGAYVFKVTTTGFDLLGSVTQYPPGAFSDPYMGSSGGHDIYRSVIIGNALYTISQDEVMASDLSTFSTLATVTLTESRPEVQGEGKPPSPRRDKIK